MSLRKMLRNVRSKAGYRMGEGPTLAQRFEHYERLLSVEPSSSEDIVMLDTDTRGKKDASEDESPDPT